MPGILPMKVIRVGSSAQSRIAQACDRCRSKKIRCDGIRPCCTQCANVGFECKTSDKLSRRAFPRGYTESLEDRVRGLEAEVRELKDLLDEKDEKIDVLSRIHSFSPPLRMCSASLSPAQSESVRAELASEAREYVDVDTSAIASSNPFASGVSTTAALIESFNHKAQNSEKPCPEIDSAKFVEPSRARLAPQCSAKGASKIPPRLLSDQYINIFFQEWAPLLPILHRPIFLRTYEDFLANPDASHWHSNKQAVAQLFLIFEIAALSSVSRIRQSTTSYEPIWRKALHAVASTPSVTSLQCHVLAQLCYLLRADYTHLARHRAVGVSMCHQLGLHQNRKRCAASPLETETMKKVFWCQYAVDKFASVASGTPTLLREKDITAEYPRDVDDENVSPQGFSPALPGELTKMSGALALFKASRILAQVIEELYPSSTDYQLSIRRIHELSEELEKWSQNLPKHLRLRFSNDKPSTATISCRSPLLSLAYFFIRSLIHRPVVCYGQKSSASASTIVLAESAKHTVQILELLDERRMSYTFPFSKSELLLVSGFSLLWQCLDLPNESKLLKDNQKSISSLLEVLNRDSSDVSAEFHSVASAFVAMSRCNSPVPVPKPILIDNKAAVQVDSMSGPDTKPKSPRKQLQAIASRFPAFNIKAKPEDVPRRTIVPKVSPAHMLGTQHRASSSLSISSTRSAPVLPMCSAPMQPPSNLPTGVNLDYFPIGEGDESILMKHPISQYTGADWEQLLTDIDCGQPNIYNGIYGGRSPDGNVLSHYTTADSVDNVPNPWAQEAWAVSTGNLQSKVSVPQSLLSFSEESLTSGEDLVFSAAGSNSGSAASSNLENSIGEETFKGIVMPHLGEDHDLDEYDTGF